MRGGFALLLSGCLVVHGCAAASEDNEDRSKIVAVQEVDSTTQDVEREVWRLEPGFCREGAVTSGGQRRGLATPPSAGPAYRFSLAGGQYLDIEIEQLGTDVVVEVWRDNRELELRIDSPTGSHGVEKLALVANATSEFVLYAVEAGGEGRFRACVRALRQASREDRIDAQAWRDFSQAQLPRKSGASIEPASALFQSAAERWQAIGAADLAAAAWEKLGLLYYRHPATHSRSVTSYKKALALYRERGDLWHQARLRHDLARAWAKLGLGARAIEQYRASLELWNQLAEVGEQASVLNDLANQYDQMGDLHLAIEVYTEAIERWRSQGLHRREATTLVNLGHLYMSVGNPRRAAERYRTALGLLGRGTTARDRPLILVRLGDALLRLEEPQAAMKLYREALGWSIQTGDRRSQALALNSIGQAQKRAQRPLAALDSYQRALELYRSEGDRWAEMVVLSNFAAAYEALGRIERAQELYERAFESAQLFDSTHTLLEIHHGLARIERSRGHLDVAKGHLDRALRILATLQRRAVRIDMRSSFLDLRIGILELMVSVLVDLAARDGEPSYLEEALVLTEHFRSQGFLDEIRAPCHRDQMDPATWEKLSQLARRINHLHRPSRERSDPRQTVAVGESLPWLLERYWQIEAVACRPLSLTTDFGDNRGSGVVALPGAIGTGDGLGTRDLVDSDTILLEYLLTEQRGYLWVVTSKGVDLHLLPPRKALEALVFDLHSRLARSPDPLEVDATHLALAEVARGLLGPVGEELVHFSRLVVVPSGALHSISFASLPNPFAPSAPIGQSMEVAYLPSIAALAQWRRTDGRNTRGDEVAILADPVVTPEDPRWPVGADETLALGGLSRLDYSAEEARQIRALARNEPGLFALGLSAHRDQFFSRQVGRARWLHIASHSLYDSQWPVLSSLVFSVVDSSGHRRDGLLRSYEIPRLNISADLVTLSACETARGEALRGESLTGLGRSFLHAGARHVLVSLWPVDDAATARLMSSFYSALWGDGERPAKALYRAQSAVRADPRWGDPYFWAPFVLYGDWLLPSSRQEITEPP